jgi:hypothetical protein
MVDRRGTMKQCVVAFVCGVASVLGYVAHLGPDALLTLGSKWQAAQRTYAVHIQAQPELDESLVADALAYEAPKAKRRK